MESEQATPVDPREGSRVRQTPKEWCCGNNNKDEDNSPEKNELKSQII